MDSFFERSSENIRGCSGDRRFASDSAKKRLEQLETMENQIKAAKDEFTQLAIASRLKSEYFAGVCETERRKLVEINVRWRQLSHGRLLIVEVTNCLSSATLINWVILIQISPLALISDQKGGSSMSHTYAHSLPRLDARGTIALEIYFERDDQLEFSVIEKPLLLRCSLARQFMDDRTGLSHTLSFCISSIPLAANDMVCDRSQPTFSLVDELRLTKQLDSQTDVNFFRFCVGRSFLQLLFPGVVDLERRFIQWLFPQVGRWDWPVQLGVGDKSSKTAVIHRSPVLTFSANAMVRCTAEERAKTDDVSIMVEVTSVGFDATTLANSLKTAMLIKLLLTVHHIRKYPANVTLNRHLLFGGREMKGFELIEFVLSKFPIA